MIGWCGAGLIVATALATSIWPAVRNLAIYGKPHVDNYEIFDTPQRRQPPGALARMSFYDLRLPALFAHPWLHVATLDSFWTQIYARAWFEHVGFNNTLYMHRPWMERRRAVEGQHPIQSDPNYYSILLNYDESVTPGQYRWIAWALYAAGLPLTILALIGLGSMIWKARAGGAALLLSANAVLCLLIPVLQTMRIPIFAAMKIEFSLCAISSAAFAIAWALFCIPSRWQRMACGVVIGLLGAAAFADAAFVVTLLSAVRSASAT